MGTVILSLSGMALIAGAQPPVRDHSPEPVGENRGTPGIMEQDQPRTGESPGDHPAMEQPQSEQPGIPQPLGEAPRATQPPSQPGEARTGEDKAALSHQDVQFLQQAAEQHMGGIILGFVAIEKGNSDEVKKHGHQLIDASVKANKALMELAGEKGVFIAVDQLKLPTEELTTLSEKAGPEFDSAMVIALLNNGTQLQSRLRESLANLTDAEVRQEAEALISRLGEGLSKVRDLASAIGMKTPLPVGEPPLPEKEASPSSSPEDAPPKNEADKLGPDALPSGI